MPETNYTRLSLICLPFGKDLQDLFVVRPYRTALGFDLKEPILKHLSKTDVCGYVSNIVLYRLSIPIDDNLMKNINNPEVCKPLPLHLPLLKVFPAPFEEEYLHVLVRPRSAKDREGDSSSAGWPSFSMALPSPNAAFRVPEPPSADQVGPLRAEFIRTYLHAHVLPLEPQADNHPAIYCNRPHDMSAPIPLTLLHPVFGRFVDECETYVPTPGDHALVHEMAQSMADFYPDSMSRRTRVTELFANHGACLDAPTNWGEALHGSVEDAPRRLVRPVIMVVENEVGSVGIDPYAQGALEYIRGTRPYAAVVPNSVVPSLIITIFGPYLSVAGAVWGTRPIVQVLSPAIPFHFHPTDQKMRTMAARHLGAFLRAFSTLVLYYLHDGSIPGSDISPPRRQVFPYPTHFKPLSGTPAVQDFVYTSQPSEEKLVFLGVLPDTTPICIKFVQHYSPAAHLGFAGQGAPPRLLGLEQLSGGWYMVVVDQIRAEHVDLYPSAKGAPPARDSGRDAMNEFEIEYDEGSDGGY